jgi:hypothetical protein
MYTPSSRVEGFFILDQPLSGSGGFTIATAPTGFYYSFTDGRTHVSLGDTLAEEIFNISYTDGVITDWGLRFRKDIGDWTALGDEIRTIEANATGEGAGNKDWGNVAYCNTPGDCETGVGSDGAGTPTAGTWNYIPEPGTGSLLALGLALLGYRERRHRA